MKSIIEAKKLAQILSKEKGIKLKQALELLAKENNFSTWKDYKNSLDTFWYEKSSSFLNHWFTQHQEALDYQKQYGGYLLTYKGQYFVASADYIEHLGIDSKHEIWKRIDFDVSSSNALEKVYEYLISNKGDQGD
jgi:hypothetical protein